MPMLHVMVVGGGLRPSIFRSCGHKGARNGGARWFGQPGGVDLVVVPTGVFKDGTRRRRAAPLKNPHAMVGKRCVVVAGAGVTVANLCLPNPGW